MAFRNQNRNPQSTFHKKDGGAVDAIPFDKRRKIGVGRADGTAVGGGRERKVLSAVNTNQEPTGPDAASGEGSEKLEFTKEEIDALLNEKIKGKKFDLKGKMEQITESNKKLKLCIKWFQGVEQNFNQDLEKVRSALEAAEKKCLDMEIDRKNKEDELNATIMELRQNYASLENKFAKEQSDKLDAMESHSREKEARAAAENMLASTSEELKRTAQEKIVAEQEVAAWEDRYNRLQEYNRSLQQYNSRMQTDLTTAQSAIQRIEKEKSAVVENLSTLRGHCSTLQEQITLSRTLQEEASKQKEATSTEIQGLRGELQQVRDDRDRLYSQVQLLVSDIEKYKESTGKSVVELDNLMIKSNALEETCASQAERLRILQLQLETEHEKLKMVDLSASETRAEYEEQKRVIVELKARLADAEFQLNEGEKLRKKLHNTILELKGNIRVFCRVRPLLPEDGASSEAPVISYPTSTEAHERGIDLVQSGQRYSFMYDKVFNHDASQHDVFVEISQLVQSALDGYKVCIFAYGQTGSGKTYTMMGRPEISEQKGLIPRSLEQVFQASQTLSAQGWKYKMQASMLEIYNETIRDLLAPNRSGVDNAVSGKQYAIKHDANGNTYVSDLTIVDVCSINEVSSLLRQAAQSRSVGKTHMNEQSSRSHFVFTLRISGVNEGTEQQVHGVLNLIDLAGSERLSRSGATGDRLKETQAINKSLSCLADVIFALAKKDDHVPFRNSKLTYLLQPCLGGDSKTLMFVNVSPDPSSVGESLCSLRFASRVNSCEIGIPRRQTATQRSADSRLSYG